MCGIAGALDLDGRRVLDERTLQRMTDAIRHRGPDDVGHHIEPGIALGVRRLAIVDPEGGHQPLCNEDRSIWGCFNGELFDYPDIQRRLVDLGHTLATRCDAELPVHLWEQHGDEFLLDMKGQFALSLWNSNRRELILARDRVGIAPLYWCIANGHLLWASEVKAILASGLVRAEPDVRGLDQVFSFLCTVGDRTCFAGINVLQPGHYLKVRGGAISVSRYWDLDFPDEGDELPSEPRVVRSEQMLDLLQKAVARRLRADVPVASYLSGGVDSALVGALASEWTTGPLRTFTISFTDPAMDESIEALEIVQRLGATHTVTRCDDSAVASHYARLIEVAETPVIDTSCVCLMLQAETVHNQRYKVVLTGEGADEALAGYYWFKAEKLARVLKSPPLRPLGRMAGALCYRLAGTRYLFPSAEEEERLRSAIGCVPAREAEHSAMSVNRRLFYSDDMRQRLGDYSPYDDLQVDTERIRRWHPLNQSIYFGYKILLAGLLLSQKGDRVAMSASVETRYPYLDEDLIRYTSGLHPNLKLRFLTDKYVLREAARRVLPRHIAYRRKHMFRASSSLAGTFLNGSGHGPWLDLLSDEMLMRTGYFEPAKVHAALRRYRSTSRFSPMRAILDHGLMAVLAVQLWHQTFMDGQSR